MTPRTGGPDACNHTLLLIVVALLQGVTLMERVVVSACRDQRCRVVYRPAEGKAGLRLPRVLDECAVADHAWLVLTKEGLEEMQSECRDRHCMHRPLLAELADVPKVKTVHHAFAPGEMRNADRRIV